MQRSRSLCIPTDPDLKTVQERTEIGVKECAHIEAFQSNYKQRFLQQDIEQNRQILHNEVSACFRFVYTVLNTITSSILTLSMMQ